MKENRNTESYPLTTDREKSNFLKATFINKQKAGIGTGILFIPLKLWYR